MALSIREQIMANWVTTLEGISIANGYNTDIGKVERFRLMSMDQAENVIIEVKQGTDRSDLSGTLNLEGRLLDIQTIIKVRHNPDEDDAVNTETLINQIEQDIHKAVMTDRTRNGKALTTFFESSGTIELDEAGGRAGKEIRYTIPYRHIWGDMANG